MPDAVTVRTLLGVEVTKGTGVTADRWLPTLSVDIGPEAEAKRLRVFGSRFAAALVPNKEWASGSWEGAESYDEAIYPLAGLISAPTITTPGGGTNSRQHVFTDTIFTVPSNKAFTIESGDASRAQKYLYGVISSMTLDFTRDNVKFSGDLFARAVTDGITMSGSPTRVPVIPLMGGQVSVYLDTSWAALGSTKLLSVKGGQLKIGNRWNPDWAIDAAQTSFKQQVPDEDPKTEGQLDLDADATGMAFLTQFRAASTKFLRIEAIGPIIEGSITYTFRVDCAIQAQKLGKFEVRDHVKIWPEPFEVVEDPTSGKALEITVINTRTAL